MRRGFSIIELLIVLAILSVVLGISATLLRRENRDSQVKAAAEELAAVLRQTRNRAMHERAAYAVVFNIQNAPDTSGATLNNWSGGHWYRVVGPSTYGYAEDLFGNGASSLPLPLPGAYRGNYGNWVNKNFPDFLELLRTAWVDEPHVLPAHKVRFLALGDTDEGPRVAKSGQMVYYNTSGETTYPRPWFGYFDPSAKRLFAWGGYDPAKNYSGFFYEGKDGDVVGCRNNADRTYSNDFDADGYSDIDENSDGDFDDFREREVGYPIWKKGEPRPLVNAQWMDSAIMFVPNGEAIYLEWNRGRWAYSANQVASNGDNGNGVQDCSKTGKSSRGYRGDFNVDNDVIAEVGHFDRHTGGWHITLAPDAQRDGDTFLSAKEALDSISPAYRVFVGHSGMVRAFRVQRRGAGYLDGHTVWPPLPTDWTSPSAVWNRCRLGYLNTATSAGYNVKIAGRPIASVVTERMLTDRIWWFDE